MQAKLVSIYLFDGEKFRDLDAAPAFDRHCLHKISNDYNYNTTYIMKRSLFKPATAIAIVLAASTPVDAFFVPPSASSASTNLFLKTKIRPNPNHRIQHLSDHTPCRPQNGESTLYATPAHGVDSPEDVSRREMMDIALGAMTGWILGPRVTFAASLSDPSATDEIEELSRPWDEKYKLLVEYYRENGNEHAQIAEKHRVDTTEVPAWVATRRRKKM